jgi:XTP/dITP diphosphohydrolase
MHAFPIILATGNAHKAREFAQLLGAAGNGTTATGLAATATAALANVNLTAAAALGGMPHVPEDTGTFLGNARQKARAVRAIAPPGAWVLADDSGLCCDALDGAPGVETANYAGPAAPAAAHRAKLLDALRDIPDARRAAHFHCLLLLLAPDGTEHVFTGDCAGDILREERGASGFGYDPIFRAAGTACSFAELSPEEKNRRSHRGHAFAALAKFLRETAATTA